MGQKWLFCRSPQTRRSPGRGEENIAVCIDVWIVVRASKVIGKLPYAADIEALARKGAAAEAVKVVA